MYLKDTRCIGQLNNIWYGMQNSHVFLKKEEKNHTQQQQQTQKTQKQNTNKTLGLTTKEIVLEFEQGVPPPQTRQHTLTFVHSVVLLEKRNQ